MCEKLSFLAIAVTAVLVLAASLVSADEPLGQSPSGPLVEVSRGPLVESRHFGRLVAVTPAGEILHAVGDPDALVLSRSALKPLQALATVQLAMEQEVGLSTEEVAIMCASHGAQAYHLEAVHALLSRAGAGDEQLHCGPVADSRLRHNCSGKHGGMLLQAKLAGEPWEGYWEPDHPVQRRIRQAIQEFTGHGEPLQWGTDGCGVPNYALPLRALAVGYARLAQPSRAPRQYQEAASAIRDAILAHPGHLSREASFHAQLIAAAEGNLVGKSGAEGCYGLGIRQPAVGVALKIEDGGTRGLRPILLAALDRLSAMTETLDQTVGRYRNLPITNSRGDVVGQIRAASWWQETTESTP